jgi:hypothetical protein
MQVHATGEYGAAIAVDADSLTHLWRHVEEFAGAAAATAACADGIERKFGTLAELAAYENPARAAARTIDIHGRQSDPDRSITIIVGRNYGARATLSIRGDEQDVSSVRTKVLDTFSGMRAWYSPVARLDLWMVFSALLFLGLVVLQLMTPSTPSTPRPGKSLTEALRVTVYLIGFIGAAAVAILGIGRLRARYFPMVAINLGHSVRKNQVDEQVRWTVMVGFVVGIAASVAYGMLGGI